MLCGGLQSLAETLGSGTLFGIVVHLLRAYLYLYPVAVGSHDSKLHSPVSGGLGVGDPVLDAIGVYLLKDYDAIEHTKPALTIFHLMGMHVNYRVRCPNSKKQWKAEDYPNDSDMRKKNIKVMADYDNAVWYNDSVVNQIIERFKGDEAIIVYLPDHGEEVFGPGARHFFGRMHDTTVNR